VILYALNVYDMIKGNRRNRERPHKILINGQDDPEIKHYCQESGLEGTREPKFVVEIDKVPQSTLILTWSKGMRHTR